MTHPTSAPHPAGPHPSIDDLADFAEDLVEGPEAAATLREHLDGCPDCRETLAALAEVSELLGTEPAPPMPEDVAGRIDAALAAEAAARARTTSVPRSQPVPASGAGAPGSPRPAAGPDPSSRPEPPSRPVSATPPTGPGRPRRRGRRRALLATAFALAAVTLGALLLRTPAPDQATDTAAGAAAASAPSSPSAVAPVRPGTQAPKEQPAIGSARNEYREDTLAAQARELVGTSAVARPAEGEELTTRTAGPCAPASTAPLLATDHGTFAGVPADLLVYAVPGHPDQLDVYLVGTGCADGRESVLLHRTVAAR
ncbi:hypothetical protein [Kitasatospora sp. NPDC057015]|uniref:hypothetical protein n=1 Tax=Kitasatospora sp. NPDC057015 TaxID=3346001 RepID=UPI003631488E